MAKAKNTFKEQDTDQPVQDAAKKVVSKEEHPKVGRFAAVRDFVRSEKTQRLTGLSLILFASYLLIAFSSFVFTWKADQDKIDQGLLTFFGSSDVAVENWLGKTGAILAHRFMYEWFGMGAFAIIAIIFVLGFRILFKFWLLPFGKFFRRLVFSMVWLSAFLAYFIKQDQLEFLAGGLGYYLNEHIQLLLGSSGTILMLGFALLAFLVVSFDLSFDRLGKWMARSEKDSAPTPVSPEESDSLEANDPAAVNYNRTIQSELEEEEIPEPYLKTDAGTSETEVEIQDPVIAEPIAIVEDVPTNPSEEELEPLNVNEFELGAEISSGDHNEVPAQGEVELVIEQPVVKDVILTEAQIQEKPKEFGPYDPTLDLGSYQMPSTDLLKDYGDGQLNISKQELEMNKDRIIQTLNNYKIDIAKINATVGPTVTLYEIVPAPGVRISKIKNLEDDIALTLSALGIRIIAPIPGKGTIGIEVPNQKPDIVSMRTLILSEKFQNTNFDLPVALGKTITNEVYIADLAKMPHLLMAGATGQGKSVGLNAILVSLLYKKHPSQIKLVLVDPKKVELTLFNKIERHFLAKLPGLDEAIITDTKKVVNTLNSLCIEMDQRYNLLKEAGVRTIKEYNAKFIERKLNPENGHKFLPYIVLVVDEFADLIITAGREVETPIARLAQLARAIGIHLIIATQRPSVNIITGTIKANFPSRIAFRVTSKIDSRTILDAGGADQLIGRGDLLLSMGSDMIRLQCPFVDTPEVEAITQFIGDQRGYPDAFLLPEYVDESGEGSGGDLDIGDRDSMFDEAARVVVMHQQGSASLLQRKLKLGYNRAGRIIDQLEAAGVIGPFEGSKARQVLVQDPASLERLLSGGGIGGGDEA